MVRPQEGSGAWVESWAVTQQEEEVNPHHDLYGERKEKRKRAGEEEKIGVIHHWVRREERRAVSEEKGKEKRESG